MARLPHGRSHQCLECESLRSSRELVGARSIVRRFFTAAGVLVVVNTVFRLPGTLTVVLCLLVAVVSNGIEKYATRHEK